MQPNIATLIFEVVSFLILVAILAKYAYGPLVHFLDERSKQISNNIAEAKKTREDAEKNLEQSTEELNEAKRHALEMKKETKRQTEELRERTLREAEEKASALISQSREDISEEIKQAKAKLKEFVARASVAIASKIIKREIKEEDHKELLEENVENLKKL